MSRLPAHAAALGAALALSAVAPATAGAVSDLVITEHAVPATASTGETVQARVTVKNAGDTPTEANSEVRWDVTDGEGFALGEFLMDPPVCPPGTELASAGLCNIAAPIAPGESVTAVFSGSTRFPGVVEARALVYDAGTGLSALDNRPLTITGPELPEPAGPRISRLRVDDPRVRPGERATLRFMLDRAAKEVQISLWRCLGRTGCRRVEFVLNSVKTRKGRQGRNTMTYRLPADLAPGRYRLTAGAREPFHRQIWRSVRIRVRPPRR